MLHETQYYEGKREGTGKRFRESVNASFGFQAVKKHRPFVHDDSSGTELKLVTT